MTTGALIPPGFQPQLVSPFRTGCGGGDLYHPLLVGIVAGRADDSPVVKGEFDPYPLHRGLDCLHDFFRGFKQMVLTSRVIEGESRVTADTVLVRVLNNKADFFRADKAAVRNGGMAEKTGCLHYFSLFI